jgi:kumamolisin
MVVYVPLAGSKRELLPHSRPAGRINPSESAVITVRVRSIGDIKALEKRAYELGTQRLEDRIYLTREELAQQYGARAEDLDLVEQLTQQHNLLVVHRSAAERSIVLKGRLGDLLDAFPTHLEMYHHATGTYRGRQGEIHIPQHLDKIITSISGFDTRPKQRLGYHTQLMTASRSGGGNGVAATEYATRYKFPTEFHDMPLDGSGQTIAIIELGGGFRTSDLRAYFREIEVPLPGVVAIAVDGGRNDPTGDPNSADGEVMLDIEVAGAVVPKAKFAIYFAPNDDQGFQSAIRTALHDEQRKPSVISISWGAPEDTLSQASRDAYHELFVQAAALGVTICAASGDHGTADESAQDWDQKIHVDHPAADDLVLGCGGTQIDDQGNDVAWNDGTPFDVTIPGGGGWAGGGGISETFAVPAYQQNANLPKSIAIGQPGRGVPDIAMSAVNYFLRVDTSEGASGGTSAVAPLMAALVAKLNQAKQKNVGFLNPFLYTNVANGVVQDVTSGTNAIKNTTKGYKAGLGWDDCTGLGTPDGTAILNNL